MFISHKLHLVQTNAMLACASSIGLNRLRH